jgi:hypothetical protein
VQGLAGAAALTALLAFAAGCGGGGEPQDANEPSGEFPMEIVSASFPKAQGIGETSTLKVAVRNTGDETIPNVGMTIDGFNTRTTNPNVADPTRPVWIVNQAPDGADTALVGTWSLGPLPAGKTRTFAWQVTATRPGTHTLRYKAAAGLHGKAVATADGGAIDGSTTVRVTRKPRDLVVDTETGEVVERSERDAAK